MNWRVMPNNDLTIQYVVLGPDEKDVNEYIFFILEEEQWAEICPEICPS